MTETPATRDCKYSPCQEYRFFLYDPNDELTFWRTEEERDNAARDAIDCCLDENGWHEDVTGISAGMVTHRIVEINVKNRVGKLDEDGYDEAGEYWDSDEFESKCNYALQPFTPTPEPPTDD